MVDNPQTLCTLNEETGADRVSVSSFISLSKSYLCARDG